MSGALLLAAALLAGGPVGPPKLDGRPPSPACAPAFGVVLGALVGGTAGAVAGGALIVATAGLGHDALSQDDAVLLGASAALGAALGAGAFGIATVLVAGEPNPSDVERAH